jgi:hypothetical protein
MVNYDSFSKFIENDTLALEYHRISRDITTITDRVYAENVIFQYHRKEGFPHYNVNNHNKLSQLKSLINFDENTIYGDGKLNQTMHCLSLAWTYFPHWVEVLCGSSKMRPIDYWNDDRKLKEIIRKTWDWQVKHGNGTFTLNRLRQNFKIYGGNQSVSNFRPSVAKWIYNTYGGDTVWDMSCGWGGRLIGFLASNCKTYIGTDPSTKTYEGLLQIKDELNFFNKEIILHKLGSEEFVPESKSLDLCFTSPPYFDTEKYSEELTQSYKKYPNESDWINGFLTKTIINCHIGLKVGGKMLINIANTPKYKQIESETIRIAEKIGFEKTDILYMILSSVAGKGNKLEPIFVFTKK